MDDRIGISVQDGVADVQLTRPDKINALDVPMFEALVAAARGLDERKDVRVAVLSRRSRDQMGI